MQRNAILERSTVSLLLGGVEGGGINLVWASKLSLNPYTIAATYNWLDRENLPISHYENTPMQIYRKFHLLKLEIFR